MTASSQRYTKCSNVDCPLKGNCYRHVAPVQFQQEYKYFELDEKGVCEHFWKNTYAKVEVTPPVMDDRTP